MERLYNRCDDYYRHIASSDREFKRLTKAAVKDLVFLLDKETPKWDSSEGAERFAYEVRRHHPNLVRTEAEKRAKRLRNKNREIKRKETLPLITTLNNLTAFPYQNLQVEFKEHAIMEIRHIKAKIRENLIYPETLLRYRPDSEWMELVDFLSDWIRLKATNAQINYLRSLQEERALSEEIPFDASRRDISARISALVPSREA